LHPWYQGSGWLEGKTERHRSAGTGQGKEQFVPSLRKLLQEECSADRVTRISTPEVNHRKQQLAWLWFLAERIWAKQGMPCFWPLYDTRPLRPPHA